jgi:hypothetical protein
VSMLPLPPIVQAFFCPAPLNSNPGWPSNKTTNCRPERPNSCLVLGGTGAFGEWITMKVMRGGFNTRILARNFEKAEDVCIPLHFRFVVVWDLWHGV